MASTAVGVKGSDVFTPSGAGDPRVVLSVKAVRHASPSELVEWHTKVLGLKTDQALEDAVLLAFQTRDVRGGKGERAVFQTLFQNLYTHHPSLATSLVDLVPEYGCWGDLITMSVQTPKLRDAALNVMEAQIYKDEAAVQLGKLAEVSLVAKWAPREGNKHSVLAGELAKRMAHGLYLGPGETRRTYRQRVAALNRVIQTTEVLECANRWDEIDPRRVPARARTIKLAAYLNEHVRETGSRGPPSLRHPNDTKRMACRQKFKDFLEAAATGKVKISGAETLYPHELVRALSEDCSTADEKNNYDAVWSQMVAKARESKLADCIAMCDFSGSMVSSGNDAPYWVSKALGLLIASATSGPFKDKFLGFSTDPQWVSVDSSKPLSGIVGSLDTRKCEGMSTDFQKAMDQVLATLKASRVRPGDEPKNLVVITDMGWDAACGSSENSYYTGHFYRHHVKTAAWQTHIQAIRESFKRASEDMWGASEAAWQPPRIVIWNVAATYTNDFHAQADTEGVIMLAGWSPSLFKVLCEEGPKEMTSYDGLRAQLDDRRYDAVRNRVREWIAGGWRTL